MAWQCGKHTVNTFEGKNEQREESNNQEVQKRDKELSVGETINEEIKAALYRRYRRT